MALELLSKRVLGAASNWYKGVLGKELNKMGLRYEDLLNNEMPATKEALELADPDILKGRMRRLKLASDLCYKGKVLQDYAPDMQLEPFKFELYDDIQKIKARDEEIQLLNLHKK